MRLSFDDKESFMEAVESLRFNNPPSDPGSSSMTVTPQDETKEDICFFSPPSNSNTFQVRRVPEESSSTSSSSMPPHWQETNEDTLTFAAQ